MSTASSLLDFFREVVVVDTEFRPRGDGLHEVRCVCALELASGREHRMWIDGPITCPYPLDRGSLFVAHYASAELTSHRSLGWPSPHNILDTCVEFSAATAGKRRLDQGRKLPHALQYFGLPYLHQEEKDDMIALCLVDQRNHDYSDVDRAELLDYCWSDVSGATTLLAKLEVMLCS